MQTQVMSAVRNIANHNRTVICTIHSPSEAVCVCVYMYACSQLVRVMSSAPRQAIAFM